MSARLDAEWQTICAGVTERLAPVQVLPTIVPQMIAATPGDG